MYIPCLGQRTCTVFRTDLREIVGQTRGKLCSEQFLQGPLGQTAARESRILT